MKYVINNEEAKGKKLALGKFSKDIPVKNQHVEGTLSITKYRKYQFREEVEVEFTGYIRVRLDSKGYQWYSLDQIKQARNVSKIKLNRFLKKAVHEEVSRRCKYFSVSIKSWDLIKKIIWK